VNKMGQFSMTYEGEREELERGTRLSGTGINLGNTRTHSSFLFVNCTAVCFFTLPFII